MYLYICTRKYIIILYDMNVRKYILYAHGEHTPDRMIHSSDSARRFIEPINRTRRRNSPRRAHFAGHYTCRPEVVVPLVHTSHANSAAASAHGVIYEPIRRLCGVTNRNPIDRLVPIYYEYIIQME